MNIRTVSLRYFAGALLTNEVSKLEESGLAAREGDLPSLHEYGKSNENQAPDR